MNKLTLTPAEIIALKQAHRACKDKRAADRIKAVYSLGMGFSVEDVVSILMLDEETLRNYVKRYQSGGINALITDHYLGSFSKLSVIQLQELTAHLEQNTYLTVESVIAHYEKFDVFKQTTLRFFENIQQYKTELDSLLTNNFQVLNAG